MALLKLTVTVDRPLNFVDRFGNVYPVNYGFIPGVIGGDAELQDAYIISKTVTKPIKTFSGVLVAIIHRRDDNENKWVVTGINESISKNHIIKMTHFLEKYFDSEIEML